MSKRYSLAKRLQEKSGLGKSHVGKIVAAMLRMMIATQRHPLN